MIPGSANPLLLATAAEEGISRSLRFNSADSAYLSRTPSTAGNRKTWTWAGWVKRTLKSGVGGDIFSHVASAGSQYPLFFDADDTLNWYVYTGSYQARKKTSAVYRDPSAWYHIVAVWDTTNATAADRMRLYVNGTRVTTFSISIDPGPNLDSQINNTVEHGIGTNAPLKTGYNDIYFADIYFLDGITPGTTTRVINGVTETILTDFGEFDDNGIWQPKAYTGSYGTNGFHLPFSDNSTAAALGTDTSGNGNTWTISPNISVAAGAGNDSLVDVPTNGTETDTGLGGEVRGNYATWNPLNALAQTLSNGNLQSTGNTSIACAVGNMFVSSGKWYIECTAGSAADIIGIHSTQTPTGSPGFTASITSYGYFGGEGGPALKGFNGSYSSYGATFGNGDVIGVALDLDAGTLVFYKNGASQGTAFTGVSGSFTFACRAGNTTTGTSTVIVNAGQRPFTYTAPSGFKALCTANLPAPVVTKPSEYMDVKLYTGNGSTQTISGLGFSPDFVWIKKRSGTSGHLLHNSVVGTGTGKALYTNTTGAEGSADQYGYLSAFTSDGFTTQGGNDPSFPYDLVGANGATYVAWTWDAGSSTVPNEDGSITSSVRANPSAGFSAVKFSGYTYYTDYTIGHGLSVQPSLIICRDSNKISQWGVYHSGLTAGNNLYLNATSAAAPRSSLELFVGSPTSSVFAYRSNNGGSGHEGIAYCFAPVAGYSAFGSYVGNGSATDGPFVYTGFRPRWILYKSTAATGWAIHDTQRSGYNVFVASLYPDKSDAEYNGTGHEVDILSNGFKLRNSNSRFNSSGSTYIYAAFAESPFQYARAR